MATTKFTERWLQSTSLVPADGRAEFIDSLCPGLHLRVTVRGTRTFSAMYRVNGELRRETIGRYPIVSLANARETALDMMRKAQDAGNARERRARAEGSLTYGELVEAYINKYLKLNARTWKSVQSGLTRDIMQPFMKRPAAAIARRDIIKLIDEMVEAGSPQGAVNQLRHLKMLFNWAVGRDMIDFNPANGVKPPVRLTERDRFLSDPEISAVWKAIAILPLPFAQMYRMFFLTGQRRTEVATMCWNEVVGDVWTIPREKVKKDRAHAVPLTKTALGVLASLRRHRGDGYVFTTTDGEAPSSNFNKTKAALDKASGVTDWTIHDIRRTVRTNLAELGVPREIARKVINHEEGKVDRIYNRHEYLAEKREALAKWEKKLLRITRC